MKKKILFIIISICLSFLTIVTNNTKITIAEEMQGVTGLPSVHWGLQSAKIFEAQKFVNIENDSGTIIGIMDSGIDGNHTALEDAIYEPQDNYFGHKDGYEKCLC